MNTTASGSVSDAKNKIIAKNKLKPASRKKKQERFINQVVLVQYYNRVPRLDLDRKKICRNKVGECNISVR